MTERKIIAVTGAEGFVGKNLLLRLAELGRFEAAPIVRETSASDWNQIIAGADAVIHLAGVNRPQDPKEFAGNQGAAAALAAAIEAAERPIPVIYASSTRAAEMTPYGESKKAGEDALLALAEQTGSPAYIFRLPNVFGKWCRPNYNSAVATFCHNVARGLPITVNDPTTPLSLVYIDDVVDAFIALLDEPVKPTGFEAVKPVYSTTVGDVADAIRGFHVDRGENMIADVGSGLMRALYATYVSYLPHQEFAYEIVTHRDQRGTFSEVLKTRSAGQFSFLTAAPGVTRGGHYHHTKTEKFIVVQGEALFRFRHMLTGETHEVRASADTPMVVETVPGWTHDITNVGEDVLVSMLWANELFDPKKPDTVMAKL